MKLLALALLLAAPAGVEQAGSEDASVAAAVDRGRLLYAYDRAAWLGTDDMMKNVAEPAGRLGGYIAEGPADAPRLTFYDKAAEPRAVYVARFDRGRLIEGKLIGPADDAALSVEAALGIRALAAARAALAKARLRPCAAKPFNTVVLPATTPAAPTRVYFLTPQTDWQHLPFGGHFEFDVAPDGVAGPPRAFTKACMAMPVKPPAGGKPVAVTVSHLLDPTPTEIHVFLSLSLGKPVYVATMNPSPRLWAVNGARVSGPRPLDRSAK